jgi:hypothetical protein
MQTVVKLPPVPAFHLPMSGESDTIQSD